MKGGARRHLIRVERPVKVKTATGGTTITWELFKQMWASIKTLRSFEKQSANASWPGSDSKISIWYVSGILPTMRINHKGKIYSILGINNIEERNRDLEFICQSGVSAS